MKNGNDIPPYILLRLLRFCYIIVYIIQEKELLSNSRFELILKRGVLDWKK